MLTGASKLAAGSCPFGSSAGFSTEVAAANSYNLRPIDFLRSSTEVIAPSSHSFSKEALASADFEPFFVSFADVT